MPDTPRLTRTGSAPKAGIVHLGPGAFFRAFNAVFTDEAMASNGGNWGIIAVSLRSTTARDHLEPQGNLYTSITLSPSGKQPKQIGSISKTLVAPDDPQAVVTAMSDPSIHIVSMTITEKGYCYNQSENRLDTDNPDVAHDLKNLDAPRSAVGFLVAALSKRQQAGVAPFTVLSCDNMPSNGALTKRMVLEFANQIDVDLADWIKQNCTFPSTMVDRITPATTQSDITDLAHSTGYSDLACVVHEPFRQWVIEDNFVTARPAWETAGAQFVKSVEAHELMKLRCLNGTHSTLAYLGYLAGHETISDTVGDTPFADLCKNLWATEIIPTIPEPEGEDLSAYCEALLKRYNNPAIQHRTWQIAMDGSQKLPQRLLGTIRDNLETGGSIAGLCLAVAGWMRYIGGVDEKGTPIDVRDPMAEQLKATCDTANSPTDKVHALLAKIEIFDTELASNTQFSSAVTKSYEKLVDVGARQAVIDHVSQKPA